MHRHRFRRAVAAAAGVVAALLVGAAASGAAAAAPTHLDPAASPSTDPSSPSPSPSDPAPSATASPTPDPSGPSPRPSYDMWLTGSSVKGHVGGIVEAVVMVHTAGAPAYSLGLPIRWGNAEYVGHCDSREVRNSCLIDYTSKDTVDTRVLPFRITQPGTTRVPVTVYVAGGNDPNQDNNRAYVTITNGVPGTPHDMASSAPDVSGRVGDVVTLPVTVRTAGVPLYHVWLDVPTNGSVQYVGDCERREDGASSVRCLFYRKPKQAVETLHLKFKVVKTGTVKVDFSAWPTDLPDPEIDNNRIQPGITGLPAAGGGGGDDDGGSDDDRALPTTGSPVATVALTGTALLAVGLPLFFLARRRRATRDAA